jgi:tripartite motif-containing protein 71
MRSRHTPVTATFAVALAVVTTVGVGLYSASTGLASTVTFSKTLAGPSTAPMYPSGLIWDPGPCAGGSPTCIVVADTGYNRVTVFNPASSTPSVPVLTIGSLGAVNGQFNTPRDVAVDTNVGPNQGDIYVADAANSRIQAFSPTGTWLWTSGVIGVGSCVKPAKGTTAPCALNEPLGISFDATDNEVLVADTGHSEIKGYDVNGNYLWESPKGILASPREARRGPDGEIWVADYHNEEIKAFAVPSGQAWPATLTTPNIVLGDGLQGGHGNGEINSPYNVAFSPDGTIAYVSDIGNDRIAVYNISNLSDPIWLGAYGKRCNAPCPNPPGDAQEFAFLRRVAVETNGPGAGDVIGDDFWGNGIDIWAPPTGTTLGAFFEQIEGAHAPAPGFAQAYGVTVSPVDGTLYVVDRLNQRIERFTNAGVYENTAGSRGVGLSTFSWPEDAAVAPDGTLWIADTRNSRLEHWNANLTCVAPCTDVGTTGPGVGQFNYIMGIAVDSTGTVWTADTNNNRIESYNPTSHTFATYGSVGTGNCQFEGPQGVAIGPGGVVYVADTGNNRIVEMSVSGGACTFIATYSTGLSGPQGVAVAGDGTVWVADSGNDDIVHLTASLINIGDGFGGLPAGTGNTQFDDPHSLVVYGETLYVADTYNNRIQEYNITGD